MSQNTAVDELNTYNFIIAGNIRHYLEANHLTQKQAAELSGLKHSTINSWVTGRNFPRPEKLSLLASVLRVPVLEFYQKHPEDTVYQTVGERQRKLKAEPSDAGSFVPMQIFCPYAQEALTVMI